MNKKPALQSALNLGYSNTPPKLDGVTLAWECATPSCSTEKSSTKSYAPRSYPHTPEQIAEEIRVDEEGRLWWKKQIRGKGRPRILNKPIGNVSNRGYIKMAYNGTKYEAHIIAFCLYYGRWPLRKMDIDHLNGIKKDNRKENLREVSHAENGRNWNKLSSRNTSGYNGVNWNSNYGKWRATVQIDGKQIHKHFSTKEEAIICRAEWEKEFNISSVESCIFTENTVYL